MYICFTASASKTLQNEVIAIIGGHAIPVYKTDACGSLVGAGCPLLPHTPLVFNSSGTMRSGFPQHVSIFNAYGKKFMNS